MQGLGALNAAQDTMPNIKAVMTAIILGIIPFLTLFLLTPLWVKALKFMTGSLLWLATWGIMMAVMHTATMDQAMTVLSDIAINKIGLDAFMLAQTDGVKALMFFGKMQSNSLMMATAIAIAVYGFGSYAMTGIAQGQAQNMQHMGEGAAQQALTPEGRAGVRNSIISGVASEASVSNVPPEGLSSGGWARDTGSEAIVQKSMGQTAMDVGTGQQTSLDANQAIGQFNESSKTGQGQSYQDFTNMTGTPMTDNATSQAYAKTNQGQADAKLLNEMQTLQGAGDSQAGASLFAASNGEQFAKLDKLHNIAELKGMDSSSPEDLMSINEDMANNNGNISMTGQQIFASPLAGKLDDQQLQDINNNWSTPMAVRPGFNPDGGIKDAQIGTHTDTSFTQNATQENKHTVDTSDVNRDDNIKSAVTSVQSGTNVDTSSHFDDATIKGLMQNTHNDPHYQTFEDRFNQAKGVSSNPTDDDKAARDNIINDVAYGFKDVDNKEVESDQIRIQNETSGTIGTPGKGLLGSSASNVSSRTLSNNQEEHTQVDTTRGKIADIYEQSDNASQFLSKVNDFHTNQYNKMQETSQAGDLSKDNPTVKDKKNS